MQKVLTVFGTRPEAIKMAPVVRALQACRELQPVVCVTGQHRQILDQMLGVFGIAADHDLDLMRPDQTLEGLTAAAITALAPTPWRWWCRPAPPASRAVPGRAPAPAR